MSTILNQKGRSQGEQAALEVAEDARETEWSHPSFVAELFMGNLELGALMPYPEQSDEDKKIGDEYCAKLDKFFKEKVDSDKIDEEQKIPKEVLKGLAEIGAFGLKIPKKYGGMGLTQVNYLRALATVNRYDSSVAATLSAHQSIGVPQPLYLFGTEAQKEKYLPQFAKGAISAFALTEPDVGSDPAKMSTIATPSPDGSHYSISGQKLWCTNGLIADVMVVMAVTPSITVNGKEKKQITAFIVEKTMPGIEYLHRCEFMGLRGIENGLIKFNNVKVPKENIIWGPGKGLRLALITLNAGRLSLPACCVGGSKQALEYAKDWSQSRVQWGTLIGGHEAVANKLGSIAATIYGMEAMTLLCGIWVDKKSQDIRLEAAMAKAFTSVISHKLVEEVVQIRGGRGYERAPSLKGRGEKGFPVERMLRDSRINQIVEGTTEILRLFIAREALDKHLKIAGDVMNPKLPIGKKLVSALKAGMFYAWWLPTRFIHFGWWPRYAPMGELGCYLRCVHKYSRKLARNTFFMMLRYGPKLERHHMQLMRLVEIATELFAMTAVIARANKARGTARFAEEEKLAVLFCKESYTRMRHHFRELWCNSDKSNTKVSKSLLDGKLNWVYESR